MPSISFNDWIAVRESNARKRAVWAAIFGIGPALPGSYAASPNTNPYAMDIASKTGLVKDIFSKKKKKKKKKKKVEEAVKNPDYSFDAFQKKVEEFKQHLQTMLQQSKKDEEDVDKKKSAKEKELEQEKEKSDQGKEKLDRGRKSEKKPEVKQRQSDDKDTTRSDDGERRNLRRGLGNRQRRESK